MNQQLIQAMFQQQQQQMLNSMQFFGMQNMPQQMNQQPLNNQSMAQSLFPASQG
jgi:hypothetical protein